MAYENIETAIETAAATKLSPLRLELETLNKAIYSMQEAIKVEDSKRHEEELKENLKGLKHQRVIVWNKIEGIKNEAFKDILADDNRFPRNHPKFEKVYDFAYRHGHPIGGYEDIEAIFNDVVDIAKD